MIDTFGRTIDYLRISITDRCNFRCRYCMPGDLPDAGHDAVLRYEELGKICRAAVACGIDRFKITGGEPFVRKDAVSFISRLKKMDGVRAVTVTTNGFFLEDKLPALAAAGINGINISLDSLDREQFRRITGTDGLSRVLQAIHQCSQYGIRTKINAVLLKETADQILPLAEIAQKQAVDVRFIEVMPIGSGRGQAGITADAALQQLRRAWPDLTVTAERRGNGPAVYYESRSLRGDIGFIAANSHRFCSACNRLRLTSTGFLKPCLCYDMGIDLKSLVRSPQAEPGVLERAVRQGVQMKPSGHCFADEGQITEHKGMNQIGG